MTSPSVLLLYNQPELPPDHPDYDSEFTVLEVVDTMSEILQDAGYRIRRLGLEQDPTVLWTDIKRRRPDVVFNLYEGQLDNTETESYVAGLLQWSGVPFTGSLMPTLSLARDKQRTKLLLRGAGVPTAPFFAVESLPVPQCELQWPVIAKPACQDASVGLAQESVCTDQQQLEARVRYLLETYGPVLVEEYIPGREFNIALVELPELQHLPPAEIVFPEGQPGVWPILTYNGKWKPGHPEYDTTPPKFPADVTPAVARKLGRLAMSAYRLLGCRDYARVDMRMTPAGKAYILEVNPNPEISPTAGFAGCLGSKPMRHCDFVLRLVDHALNRKEPARPTFAPPVPVAAVR
jgi:D-alanine-D-alanine ligase